ncbi:MAG: hypothetical protein A2234_07720 [Elusimicrobia bacterium RIFOXYA2_FULL_58_8]|nr:MAG: hypothetical protein A2234_07720 [Elusimicrobia bacterium RIFOXYA2_FULL_58_8]OGS13752.1 MAG: hypothetical protein A2285_03375 [Elusimicrobia bacterium RIFOXYA12_FULL_57_11]
MGPKVFDANQGVYELRKYTDVILGSEETEPNTGQDYVRFLGALADALLAGGDMQFAKDSRRKTLKFADPDARDLGHFAQIVDADAKDPVVRAAALNDYIRTEVVIASEFTGGFQDASGLAAYLPVVYMDEDNYDQMSFAAASYWTTLIRKMKSTPADNDYWDDYPED